MKPARSLDGMSRPIATICKTADWPTRNEALRRRGGLAIRFKREMNWDAVPNGNRNRQQTQSDATIQACLSMTMLFGMALRQTAGFVERPLPHAGMDCTVPDFSTLSLRRKTLTVNIPDHGCKVPLHLLIDGTGIRAERE